MNMFWKNIKQCSHLFWKVREMVYALVQPEFLNGQNTFKKCYQYLASAENKYFLMC